MNKYEIMADYSNEATHEISAVTFWNLNEAELSFKNLNTGKK